MDKKEVKQKSRFYKFPYLFLLIGPRTIFFSKKSWDFWISILAVIIITIRQEFIMDFYAFAINWAIISATLLGLIIASYAIVASISDNDLLMPLVESGFYQYSIFQFTWSSLWLFVSLMISLMEVSLGVFLAPIVIISSFAIIYGIFGSFISIFRALHDLSIMNARKNQPLKDSWARYENRKKDNSKKKE